MKTVKTNLIKLLLSVFVLSVISPLPAFAATNCTDTTDGRGHVVQSKVDDCLNDNPINKRINQVVNFLAAGVGIVVTGVIILGGIQYIMSGDNANAVAAARQRIMNGLIALAAFLFLYAFIQWLVPGGVFG